MLDNLNQVQQEAVTHKDGPVLILAGAGSGKTRVLTYRIAYLIKEKDISPFDILAITFTNKAANEMKERIAALVGRVSRAMWISTFHSTCARVLRQEAERLGYSKNFVIYDSNDSGRLITYCMRDLNIDNKRYPSNKVAAAISSAKNELMDAETFRARAQTYAERVVADVYKLYQDRIYKSNALDFDDLIMVTVNLFQLFPSVLDAYQEKFKYILVDEYQDTNPAQYELIRTLAGKHRNLCVVGDADQSIYRFRGADIRNILEFERDYPDCRVIKLEQNYRSTKTILNAANYVMQNNRSRKPKALWTENGKGDPIVRYQGENEHEEATFVAGEIEQMVKKGRQYKEFSVFYRTNAQSRVLEEIFLRYGVPYRIIGGLKFYERAEIKDVLAYLRVLSNPQDTVSLKRIINVPRRGLGNTTIQKVDAYSLKHNISFSQALNNVDDINQLSTAAVKNIKKFLVLLDELQRVKEKETLENLTKALLDATGYLAMYDALGTVEAEGRAENVREFIGVIKEFEESRASCTLDEFLEEIALIADIDSYDDDNNAVTLMTVHNAKGLEFNIVFIVGMEDGIFPHIRSMTETAELEEERRLFYVGITRAMQKLYLCNAWSRNLWGGVNYNSPSRFLHEIPADLLESAEQVDVKAKPPSEIGAFNIGDNVFHKKFGEGRITAVKGADQVTVLFAAEGEKTLLLNYAPLEKR
ncbi:MAG: DNA helicase PcrA [Candidatus Aquicultor secundus]|uniref:ATP-dependent DNA helicase n=1 Tax=Candidatus Aquicultor secundus TaxID=1973895 RepID=A0A2M7T7M4_9ACTN|nr:DNA helicase PcrA [Candidatus Aquicultor secundus]NCO66160.1 DNA helicase PcrA [Solirubrobacter sp.]OIO83389.1 MAG: ATP-dependent DNA helicase PcrA [Candidatus Aquicultor secundus]PIU27354.1 MAG: DNA helicase PcrA [Candidatus Aquicultor secundus]PIW22932.1 MAG: DNA helicase PcrA [Candidatus Aquicultor secundus]PIX51919.1 MAG: DNA helicase PcrA [Candidatus Aquicultor secundus]